jgi:Protein of unknown function (DUF1569)
MPLLDTPGVLDRFDERLAQLTPETPRRWGTMTSHEMLCHLSDSFLGMLHERATSKASSNAFQRQLVRFIALHTPLPWPAGVPTRPEVNPHQQGTRPGAFESDRRTMYELMHRFARPDSAYAEHPMFGPLTRREWMLWGYRHVDHHFRQFGV